MDAYTFTNCTRTVKTVENFLFESISNVKTVSLLEKEFNRKLADTAHVPVQQTMWSFLDYTQRRPSVALF